MFYQKTQKLLELALWMQSNEDGISIADIIEKYNLYEEGQGLITKRLLKYF